MGYILTNLPAILAATLAGLAVGAAFLRLVGAAVPPPGLVATAALGEFWLAAILAGALILAPPEAGPWVMALGSAVVIWIGFVVPTVVVTTLRHRVGIGAALADCGHWLAAMAAQAAVLHLIGLTKSA